MTTFAADVAVEIAGPHSHTKRRWWHKYQRRCETCSTEWIARAIIFKCAEVAGEHDDGRAIRSAILALMGEKP